MRGRRRGYLLAMALAFAGLGLFAAAQPARAQDYPNRPVHILVGFAPGSVAEEPRNSV